MLSDGAESIERANGLNKKQKKKKKMELDWFKVDETEEN